MPNERASATLSIAHVSSPQVDKAGDFIYRVDQPNQALASLPNVQVIELSNLSQHKQRIFEEADVLIINLLGDPDFLPVIQKRRESGQLTVFEINDYFLGFQPWNPVYYFFKDPENKACILQLTELCDCVQVTCRELARRFSPFNSSAAVFANQMTRVGTTQKPESPVTIGWGGSHGHLEDIRHAAPALIGWFKEHPEVRLSIMGSKEIYDLFSELDESQKNYTPPGSLDDFYRFLQTLHIGLAPILPTDYNLCRSDVKFLEYGAFGAVPVCSDLEPYRSVQEGETGFLFKDPAEIPSILDRLISDPSLLRKVAGNAYSHVCKERMESQHAEERLNFYMNELKKIRGDGPYRNSGPLSWVSTLPNALRQKDSDYISLEFTNVEKNLYNGLVHQFQHNQIKKAAECFNRAQKESPELYLSYLYLGNTFEQTDPSEAASLYKKGLTLNPASCFTAVLLGLARLKMGEPDDAEKYYQKAIEISPKYARAWLLLGITFKNAGDVPKAIESIQRSLQENPYYSPAHTQLGTILLQQGDLEQAKGAFEKGLSLNPESELDCFFLGNIALKQGNLQEAESQYKQSISYQPQLAPAYVNLSRLYQSQGKHDQANEAREEALRLQPDLKGKI